MDRDFQREERERRDKVEKQRQERELEMRREEMEERNKLELEKSKQMFQFLSGQLKKEFVLSKFHITSFLSYFFWLCTSFNFFA